MRRLAESFWREARANDLAPRPVYALVSLGGEQPPGYCKGWSVDRRSIERRRADQWEPEAWKIEKWEPTN